MIGNGKYFNNEAEAKKVLLAYLEKKYHKEFIFTNENSYKYAKGDKAGGYYVFRTKFKDKDGLEADAVLPQSKNFVKTLLADTDVAVRDDTYSDVFYTKKTAEAVEPFFRDEPFVKHVISLDNSEYAEGDLSLSVDEYFQKSGAKYWLEAVLPDGHERDYYVDIIYNFYHKLATEQSNPFALAVYANGFEIFNVSYAKSKHSFKEKSHADIYQATHMETHRPMPKEDAMVWDYYIKQLHPWLEEDDY